MIEITHITPCRKRCGVFCVFMPGCFCRVFGDGGPAYVCLCVLKTLLRFLMVKMAYEWKKKLIFAAENRVCHEQNAAIGWIAEV